MTYSFLLLMYERLDFNSVILYFADLVDALKGHVCQHVGLDTPQEHIIIHFVNHFLILHKENIHY